MEFILVGFERRYRADDKNTYSDPYFVYFVPMQLSLPIPINLEILGDYREAKITFTYDASDPELPDVLSGDSEKVKLPQRIQMEQRGFKTTGGGYLRIWTKNAHQERNKSSVRNDNPDNQGDFVPSGVELKPADLGFSNSNRTVILYVEGIKPTNPKNETKIKVKVWPGDDPDPLSLPSPDDKYYEDEVCVTAVKLEAHVREYDRPENRVAHNDPRIEEINMIDIHEGNIQNKIVIWHGDTDPLKNMIEIIKSNDNPTWLHYRLIESPRISRRGYEIQYIPIKQRDGVLKKNSVAEIMFPSLGWAYKMYQPLLNLTGAVGLNNNSRQGLQTSLRLRRLGVGPHRRPVRAMGPTTKRR